MKSTILVVTFKRDFRYLHFLLQSIKKFWRQPDSNLVIVIPETDVEAFQKEMFEDAGIPLIVKSGAEWPDNPMLWHEWMILNADNLCPESDIIIHIDSDCIFRGPVSLETYAPEGKPWLRYEPFESVARREPGVMEWKTVTERCLPYPALFETMRCMPLVYRRSTYECARREIEQKTGRSAGEYIRSCKGTFPQGFCEFVTLGNVAMNENRPGYNFMLQKNDKADPPNHVIQFWGHGDPALEQNIWLDGTQQKIVPLNLVRSILEPDKPAPVLTGKRELPAILGNLTHRDLLARWLNQNGFKGAGAEIGVMHGGYAETILKEWQGQRYYMVDLWARQHPEIYRERTDNIDYEAKYRDCVAIAGRFPITQIIRKASVEAAKDVPDGSLDWVFIDANHAYKPVLEDMDAWYPKLRTGGLLAGHDYGNDTNWPHWCEVKKAVDRWMEERNIPFKVTECSSWWAIRP